MDPRQKFLTAFSLKFKLLFVYGNDLLPLAQFVPSYCTFKVFEFYILLVSEFVLGKAAIHRYNAAYQLIYTLFTVKYSEYTS